MANLFFSLAIFYSMDRFDLDLPLLELSNPQASPGYWTTHNAIEWVQIFGGIGAAKTSHSGRMLAAKYLSMGFGTLVLTAKADEKGLLTRLLRPDGGTDLITIQPGAHAFNTLDFESGMSSGGMRENIVQVLKTVIRASEEKASWRSDGSLLGNRLSHADPNAHANHFVAFKEFMDFKNYSI